MLADEKLEKPLGSLETCVLVNSILYGKLVSTLESTTTFDQIFTVTSVPFFIPEYNILSCELDNFIFKMLY